MKRIATNQSASSLTPVDTLNGGNGSTHPLDDQQNGNTSSQLITDAANNQSAESLVTFETPDCDSTEQTCTFSASAVPTPDSTANDIDIHQKLKDLEANQRNLRAVVRMRAVEYNDNLSRLQRKLASTQSITETSAARWTEAQRLLDQQEALARQNAITQARLEELSDRERRASAAREEAKSLIAGSVHTDQTVFVVLDTSLLVAASPLRFRFVMENLHRNVTFYIPYVVMHELNGLKSQATKRQRIRELQKIFDKEIKKTTPRLFVQTVQHVPENLRLSFSKALNRDDMILLIYVELMNITNRKPVFASLDHEFRLNVCASNGTVIDGDSFEEILRNISRLY